MVAPRSLPSPCRLPHPVALPLAIWIVAIMPAGLAAQTETRVDRLRLDAQLWARQAAAEKVEAEAWALARGIPIRQESPDGRVLELMAIRNGQPIFYKTFNAVAADTVAADELWPGGSSGLDLDGAGVLLAIWDAGKVRDTHIEFGGMHLDGTLGRAVQRDGSSSLNYHATHVAGTMIAAGIDPFAKGMSFAGSLDCRDWVSDSSEMSSAAANGLLVSNHSYGEVTGWEYNFLGGDLWAWTGDQCISSIEDYRFGFYSSSVRTIDAIAYNAPYYLACWAAGNDRFEGPNYFGDPDVDPVIEHFARPCGGTYEITVDLFDFDGGLDGFDCISGKALAKNVLTVGAVQDLPGGYAGPSSTESASFSSMGPTDDGRIKPDICANGIYLYSCLHESDTAYTVFSGTSMAAPNTSGALGLLIQHHRATHGGADMRAATLKALVIHTADECGEYDGPDYEFGWGLLNVHRAAGRITSDVYDDNTIREEVLTGGNTFELTVNLEESGTIRATICWTDPPGSPFPASLNNPERMLVNDLNLVVKSAGSRATHEPWVLNPNSPSTRALRGDNNRDNVEQVYTPSLPSGEYIIQVSHDGSLEDDLQQFSLVVTAAPDCNKNGIDDYIEIAEPTAEDCDDNGIPDECDPDGDSDGVIDGCDGCPNDYFKTEPGDCGCGQFEDDTDTDGDQTIDCTDACPEDPNKSDPLFCGCGLPETDLDGDDTPDCADECPFNPDKTTPDQCGCGVPDTDSDGDETADCNDGCYLDADKLEPGQCGCGVLDTDADGDDIADCNDGCPFDPIKVEPAICGCGVEEETADTDGDAVIDCFDPCRNDADKLDPGICGCGSPDVDTDADDVLDCNESCPFDPLKTDPLVCGCGHLETDSDGDDTPDCVDACVTDPFKILRGVCGCGVIDDDTDGDGVHDCLDGCPQDSFKREPGVCGCGLNDFDSDGDGVPDRCKDDCPQDPLKSLPGPCGCGALDTDSDRDGVADCVDNCRSRPNPGQADSNGNGIGDACEPSASEDPQQSAGPSPDSLASGQTEELNTAPPCGFGAAQASLLALGSLSLQALLRPRRARRRRAAS